jgi:hypothetical protein
MISSKAILMVVFCVLLVGCVRLTDESGKVLQIGQDSAGFYVTQSSMADATLGLSKQVGQILKAQVKGSIYETGEYMSVFGACLDSFDQGAADSYALFQGWYPNGTQFIFNYSMESLQPGYFLYRGNMSAVEGTYLTEMRCFVNGTSMTAVAFGEWQNPFWVKRLALLNDSISTLDASLSGLNVSINTSSLALQASMDAYYANLSNWTQNLTIQIGAVQVNVSDSFNITWSKLDTINYTIQSMYANISNLTYNVAIIANSSVDRNDSLLAQLLYNLTGLVTSINMTGTVVPHTENAGSVYYFDTWTIKVQAYDGIIDHKLQYPDVQCYITTSQTPTSTAMTPYGVQFKYSEFIYSLNDFTWNVVCYRT